MRTSTGITLSLYLTIACSSTEPFKRLANPQTNAAIVYIYRPQQEPLALWDYTIQLYSYRTNFRTDKNPTLLLECDIANNEFIVYKLKAGDYRLEMPDFANTIKVVRIKNNQLYFIRIHFFNASLIAPADVFLQLVEKTDAVSDFVAPASPVAIAKDCPQLKEIQQ